MVNKHENPLVGLVREGPVRVVEAMGLLKLEMRCVQGVVGAVMEVSQVSRENLLMLNLSFRFRFSLVTFWLWLN